jgi:hypothetical protein
VPVGAIQQEDGFLRLTLSGRMTRGALLRALAKIISETKIEKHLARAVRCEVGAATHWDL